MALSNSQIKLAILNGKENEIYKQLVVEMIRSKYSQNDVEAITNNYLDDPENYTSEFKELQEFRRQCKQQAKTLINKIKGGM